jgi:sugar lactone lactonase YvrE
VHELGADGSRVRTIALPGGYFPSGLTTDERGKLFIADTGSSRVLRADPDGATFAEFGRGAAGDARLDQPTAVAVGPDGEIFAADVGHQRIAVFGPDLELRRQWSAPRSGTLHGMQLAVGAGRVFASDPDGGRVVEYDAEGRVLGERGAGELVRPVGVALDGKGNLYVADVGARAIFRYAVSPPGTAPTASR